MPAAALVHIPHAASLESSLDAFFDAVETFFSNLAAVGWGALALALGLHLGHLLCRSRAWFNTLRAAYPHERFGWRLALLLRLGLRHAGGAAGVALRAHPGRLAEPQPSSQPARLRPLLLGRP